MNHDHEGDIIPKADDRQFAYHNESAYPGAYIKSYPSERSNDLAERKKYSEYEFTITKHTDNSMVLSLKKHRRDIVEQRRENGKATLCENYQTILSFGELMNRIFGKGCDVYLDEEAFPAAIVEAMKNAYPKPQQGGNRD